MSDLEIRDDHSSPLSLKFIGSVSWANMNWQDVKQFNEAIKELHNLEDQLVKENMSEKHEFKPIQTCGSRGEYYDSAECSICRGSISDPIHTPESAKHEIDPHQDVKKFMVDHGYARPRDVYPLIEEIHRLKTCGTVKMMLENVNIDSFVREKEQRIAELEMLNESSIAQLEQWLNESKAETAACIDFLDTELGWEYFRAEVLYFDNEEKQRNSLENARILKNFLTKKGHGISIIKRIAELESILAKGDGK